MTTATVFRYSTGTMEPKDAPDFVWERPIPVNEFWNSFKYSSARNFLACFSQEEIDGMDLERYDASSPEEKAKILLQIVQDEIASRSAPDNPLWESDNKAWLAYMLAMISMYDELGLIDEQIEINQEMGEKRADKSNLSHSHGLAWLLTERGSPGDYEAAEKLEGEVLAFLDGRLGPDSPQSLSGRRIVAKAVWMQGRVAEAEKLIDAIFQTIDGLRNGKYAVYEDEERIQTNELVEKLKEVKEVK